MSYNKFCSEITMAKHAAHDQWNSLTTTEIRKLCHIAESFNRQVKQVLNDGKMQ